MAINVTVKGHLHSQTCLTLLPTLSRLLRMGQRSQWSTAQNTPNQQKALAKAPACMAEARQSPARNQGGWQDLQMVEATTHRCCNMPRGQRWTARACWEGGTASWATGLGGCSTRCLPLCCFQREDALWILSEITRIAPSSFQVHVPCALELQRYHSSDLFCFLKSFCSNQV